MSAFLLLAEDLTFWYDCFVISVSIKRDNASSAVKASGLSTGFEMSFLIFGRTRRSHHSKFKYILKILVLLVHPLWCCIEKFSRFCMWQHFLYFSLPWSFRKIMPFFGRTSYFRFFRSLLWILQSYCWCWRDIFSTFVGQNITNFNWKCNVFVQPWLVLLEKDIHCTITPTPSPL